jgi:hypothetical protein
MYIEFSLPSEFVRNKLSAWAAKYNIKYRTKAFKYTLRVTFDSDESYTLFAMTWVPDPKHPSWTNYRLVTDLNNKI